MAPALGQPLKWHGGKAYLARWIVGLMPPHLNYVEPFFGGGAVLFARDPDDQRLWLPPHKGVSEVANDLNGNLTRFWTVLQNEALFQDFVRRVQATPFSGVEFESAQAILDGRHAGPFNLATALSGPDAELCVRALAFFVVNRQSLAGRMKGFTGITKKRTRARMNNEVSAWLSVVDGLPQVHARLRRVLILPSKPAIEVICKFDLPETLLYLDPPYLHETRATTGEYGPHEMTVIDHQELLATVRGRKAKVMLSGYTSPLYDDALSDWNRHTFEVPNQASGAKKKERKTEVLWCNF